jgi:hypothetical protein
MHARAEELYAWLLRFVVRCDQRDSLLEAALITLRKIGIDDPDRIRDGAPLYAMEPSKFIAVERKAKL